MTEILIGALMCAFALRVIYLLLHKKNEADDLSRFINQNQKQYDYWIKQGNELFANAHRLLISEATKIDNK